MTFQKGISGNPKGRPKGSVNRQLAMLRDAADKIIPLLVDQAMSGDKAAMQMILERALPKIRPVSAPPAKPASLALPSVGAENAYLYSLRKRAEAERELAIKKWEQEWGDG